MRKFFILGAAGSLIGALVFAMSSCGQPVDLERRSYPDARTDHPDATVSLDGGHGGGGPGCPGDASLAPDGGLLCPGVDGGAGFPGVDGGSGFPGLDGGSGVPDGGTAPGDGPR